MKGAVRNTVDVEPIKVEQGTYYFKIALRKTLWRIIRLGSEHTFEEFHLAIRKSLLHG